MKIWSCHGNSLPLQWETWKASGLLSTNSNEANEIKNVPHPHGQDTLNTKLKPKLYFTYLFFLIFIPKLLGQKYILILSQRLEQPCHISNLKPRNPTTNLGDKELKVRVTNNIILKTSNISTNRFDILKRLGYPQLAMIQPKTCGYCITPTLQTKTTTINGVKPIKCKLGSTTNMFALKIRTKDKNLICLSLLNIIRGNSFSHNFVLF